MAVELQHLLSVQDQKLNLCLLIFLMLVSSNNLQLLLSKILPDGIYLYLVKVMGMFKKQNTGFVAERSSEAPRK